MTKTGATERRLVAIFAANVEGYSRLTGTDEAGTLKGLTERRAILEKLFVEHPHSQHGRAIALGQLRVTVASALMAS